MKTLMVLISFLFLTYSGYAEPLRVFVSVLPHKYLAEQIGGDGIEVEVMVPPGKSPDTYSPSPSQMIRLGRSMIYFRAGVPFECSFMEQVKRLAPDVMVVDLNAGIPLRHIEEGYDEEEGSEHHHGGGDPHVWMSPVLLASQGGNMAKALAELDPANAAGYERRQKDFSTRMAKLDASIQKQLVGCVGRIVFVYHPAFGYFTDAYGLKQVAVEQGGKSPSPRHTAELIRKAREDRVQVIFVQPQFNQQRAQVIAQAIDGQVVPLNPLEEDVPANIEYTAGVIYEALTNED